MADSIIGTGGTGTTPYFDVDVCNMALSLIGNADNYVTSTILTNNSTKEARLCNLWYNQTLKLALAQSAWKGSLVREAIGVDGETEDGSKFAYMYEIPSDCILIESITDSEYDENNELEWKREGSYIHTDAYDTIYMAYVQSGGTDDLDAHFLNYLINSLAYAIAPSLSVSEATISRVKTGMLEALLTGLATDRRSDWVESKKHWTDAGR